jgi:two-component system, cell cycle response regulator DivK
MKQAFLYVEDDALSREIMQILMEGLGQPLVTFEDSVDFIARVQMMSPQPHVIFLDIHVQPYDGFAMLDMLRKTPTHKNTRIVALTASVMNEEIARLRIAGFNGAIGKPLDFDQFPLLLERLIRGDEVWHIA